MIVQTCVVFTGFTMGLLILLALKECDGLENKHYITGMAGIIAAIVTVLHGLGVV